MKKAHIELNTNKLLGWYDDNYHGVKVLAKKDNNGNIIEEEYLDLSAIPKDCIEVSDDTWSKALEISANAYVDGEFIVKDFRSEEEVIAGNLKNKIAKANSYLKDTDWVKDYKLRHDLGLELIPEDSNKWEIIKQREIYLEFLKTL